MQKVTIRNELAALNDYWSQKVIAEANGQLFKVAKGIGTVNWHHHDDQDELFISDCRLEHYINTTGRQARVELLTAGRDPVTRPRGGGTLRHDCLAFPHSR